MLVSLQKAKIFEQQNTPLRMTAHDTAAGKPRQHLETAETQHSFAEFDFEMSPKSNKDQTWRRLGNKANFKLKNKSRTSFLK